jgi:RNA polymerase sigma-70 factor (ECF subfamily)
MARSVSRPALFRTVYERHADAVLGYSRLRVGRDHAEDAAAETFLTAFDRRASFDRRFRSARPWLYGICSNVIRRLFAAHARWDRSRTDELDAPERRESGVDELAVARRLDAETISTALREALGKLHERDREVVILLALGDLSYEELAQATGTRVGTVRSRLNRARKQLRGLLDPELAALLADPESIPTRQWRVAQ